MGLSPSEITAITVFSDASSIASILGSLFILACYAAFPQLRRLSFSLVACLAVTDILNQIFDLISPSADELAALDADPSLPTPTSCLVQAVGDNFFELSSVLWTSTIALVLYATVVWRAPPEDSWRTLARFASVCLGVPLLLTVAPGAAGAFGAAGSECWIRNSHWPWRLVAFFIPLWLCIAFNAVVYVRVRALLARTVAMAGPGDAVAQTISAMLARLAVYPFILVAVWTVPSIAALVEAASGDGAPFLLVFASATLAGLQGLLNALAYGFSPGIREELAKLPAFRACCGACGRCCARACGVEGANAEVAAAAEPPSGEAARYATAAGRSALLKEPDGDVVAAAGGA
jgi:hypothetical protein